ncbi:SH3 domain-containing protein [Phenylobacterium sp.]|jgi:hypothetical protein|uniref:SH3 domain-containing protein n=1 Tax=Phenylobacterium sp. TaxID=1871053 RepID=UPI002F95E9D2
MRTSKTNKLIGGGAAAAVLAGALAVGVGSAQAAGINGVTNCSANGGKQEAGAAIGAVVGGLIGNKVGGRHPTGETVLGAAAGAAAGSAIGCQMQKNTAREHAYGSTYTRGGYRLSSSIAPASYSRIGDTFVANRTVNLRSAPTTGSGRVGSLRAGERFQALAQVRGSDWILVGQGGVGVGYVHQAYVQPEGYRYARY